MTTRKAWVAVSAGLMLAAANVVPAAAGETTMTVSGDSTPSECGAAKSATAGSALTGSLEGCLAIFVQNFNCRPMNGFDFSVELGREEFEGTLEGKAIKFNTQYEFTAIWPAGSCPEPAVEAEVAGGCEHHVSGDGIQGVIRFYDVIPIVGKGATNFFYEGVLTISDDAMASIEQMDPATVDVAMADFGQPKGSRQALSSAC